MKCGVCGSVLRPCIRNLRIPVATVVDIGHSFAQDAVPEKAQASLSGHLDPPPEKGFQV